MLWRRDGAEVGAQQSAGPGWPARMAREDE